MPSRKGKLQRGAAAVALLLPGGSSALPAAEVRQTAAAAQLTPLRPQANSSLSLQDIPSQQPTSCTDIGCWPKIFILGAQKCATTSIFSVLARHRLVCGRSGASTNEAAKEAHFWDDYTKFGGQWGNLLNNPGDLDGYLSGYPAGTCNEGRGAFADATPSYLRDYNAAARMATVMPSDWMSDNVRLLAVLREPITRDISYYNMFRGEWVANGMKPEDNVDGLGLITKNLCGHPDEIAQSIFPSYDEAVGCELDRWQHCQDVNGGQVDEAFRQCTQDSEFVQNLDEDRTRLTDGMYAAQIPRFLKYFPRKHMMVLAFSDLVGSDEADIMQRIIQFFGLPPRPGMTLLPQNNEWDFDGKLITPSCMSRDFLQKVYADWNQRLYDFLSSSRESGEAPDEEPAFPPFVTPECTNRPLVHSANNASTASTASTARARGGKEEKVHRAAVNKRAG